MEKVINYVTGFFGGLMAIMMAIIPVTILWYVLTGARHLEICCHLYKMQVNQGLYFLHEHPQGASSWNNPKVKE